MFTFVVLNTFEAQPLSDEESSANNLEDEAATFIEGSKFSTHILVQCLILFDYLKAPGKNDKDLPSETMVWWKRDGCGPFEKQPTEKKIVRDGGKKRRPRWRLGNKELAQLWKWAEQNPAGIEAEYSHKNNRVYCWKGLRFSARQIWRDFLE
ncbi:putative THO complex, subunit THOC1 protein [Helianthus annuus]|nr:putative THO complex, subunit THOC1 protein [Helianthus annuus]